MNFTTLKRINLIQKKHDELEFRLTESYSTILVNEKEVIHLKELLANTLIELELSQFEIELLEEQL